jgi:hypothetical protein
MSEDFKDIEDVEFSREEARLLLGSSYKQISEKRWDRIRELIDFRDLALEVTGKIPKGDSISCPFHGRDSNPSFHLYQRSNDAYCYGCPPGDQYWDHTKLVSRLMGTTRVAALKWLEEKYNLPKMEDDLEDVEEENIILLEFTDVKDLYIRRVSELVAAETEDKVGLVKELMRFYFLGEKSNDPLPCARVLGLSKVRSILRLKEQRLRAGEFNV